MEEAGLIYSSLMEGVAQITFDCVERRNTLTIELLESFRSILNQIKDDEKCKVVVIRGKEGIFCTGMDFGAVKEGKAGDSKHRKALVEILRMLGEMPQVTIAFVDGKVMAGGVGIACACDLIYSTKASEFSLPEALWGMLPVLILPFILRRISYHSSLQMVLAGNPLNSEEAYRINLVDKICTEPELKRMCLRLTKLTKTTIVEAKEILFKMKPYDESAEQISLVKAEKLNMRQSIQENMARYYDEQRMPWEISNEKELRSD